MFSLVFLICAYNNGTFHITFLPYDHSHVLYRTAVIHYGDYDAFDLQDWTMWLEPGVTAVIGSVAQVYFLQRCWKYAKSRLVLAILVLCMLSQFRAYFLSNIDSCSLNSGYFCAWLRLVVSAPAICLSLSSIFASLVSLSPSLSSNGLVN
jgi:hypothetical protein